METVIGLGTAGCAIAREFCQYPQYEVYTIDTKPASDTAPDARHLQIPTQVSHESYEANCPPLGDFFKNIDTPCLFVLGGGGTVSGASLKALQELSSRNNPVSILYIHPDDENLQGETKLHHSLVFGVLQEYTRSGVFEQLFVVQNAKIEEILEDLPVIGYFKKINNFIVSAIHMVNVFTNTDSEFDTFRATDAAARICTLGVVDVETMEGKLFFDLKKPREKRYYFGISRSELETDGTLLKKIKENLKKKLDGLTKVSYGIYSTSYEANYGYCIHSSSMIQTEGEE